MNCSELKMLISVCGDCMLNMYEEWRGQDVIYIHTCIRVKIKAWPWCINPSTNVQLSLARFRIKPCFCQQHHEPGSCILHRRDAQPALMHSQLIQDVSLLWDCTITRPFDYLNQLWPERHQEEEEHLNKKKKEKGQKRRERGDAWKKSPSNWT